MRFNFLIEFSPLLIAGHFLREGGVGFFALSILIDVSMSEELGFEHLTCSNSITFTVFILFFTGNEQAALPRLFVM